MATIDTARLRFPALVLALCMVAVSSAPAIADDGAATGGFATGPNPDYGMAAGNWLVYPELFAGIAVSDNPGMSPTGQKTSMGPRVKPSFQAVNDAGLHHWEVYAGVDGQFYQTGNTSNQVQARAGVADTFDATPNLTIKALLDYTRQIGLNSVFGAGVTPVVQSANTASSTSSLVYNQYTASLSGLQKFNRFYVQPEAQVQALSYEGKGAYAGNNSIDASLGMRFGYDLTSDLSAFVDPTYQNFSYRSSRLNTNGYRVIAGLASKQIGLWGGELYAGYQSHSGAAAIRGSVGAPIVGGRLSYYPTEQLNFGLSADQSVGSYGASASSASYSRSSRYELDANYTFSSYWSARARAAYDSTKYSTFGTHTDMSIAGFGVSYAFWHNLAVTGEYQYTKSSTNSANSNWDENLFTVGLTYRY